LILVKSKKGKSMKKYIGIASFLMAGLLINSVATTQALADTFNEGLKDLPSIGSGGPVCFTPGVPEPETWAMLGVGVAMIGYQLRRRKNKK
jgi:hypothetical protein